jgi:hypothetical protein
MNTEERQEFILKEIEAIYEEFDTYLNQLIILKPFIKDLIAVAKGADPTYQLKEVIRK